MFKSFPFCLPLQVLLRVKENELQYLKKEVQCLRDELQMMQKVRTIHLQGEIQTFLLRFRQLWRITQSLAPVPAGWSSFVSCYHLFVMSE